MNRELQITISLASRSCWISVRTWGGSTESYSCSQPFSRDSRKSPFRYWNSSGLAPHIPSRKVNSSREVPTLPLTRSDNLACPQPSRRAGSASFRPVRAIMARRLSPNSRPSTVDTLFGMVEKLAPPLPRPPSFRAQIDLKEADVEGFYDFTGPVRRGCPRVLPSGS